MNLTKACGDTTSFHYYIQDISKWLSERVIFYYYLPILVSMSKMLWWRDRQGEVISWSHSSFSIWRWQSLRSFLQIWNGPSSCWPFFWSMNSKDLQQNFTSAKVQPNCNSVQICTVITDYHSLSLYWLITKCHCSYELQVLVTIQ